MTIQNGVRILTVEVITVAWMHTDLMGGYPYVGPGFDTAFADMSQAYPRLNLTQSVIFDETFGFTDCRDWATESDNRLAEFYYRGRRKFGTDLPDFTVFLLAGCADLAGVIQFAAGLNKLVISTGLGHRYISDKVHFPTFMTFNYISSTMIYLTYERLLLLYRWTTIMIIVDITSQLGFFIVAKGVQDLAIRNGITANYEVRNVSSYSDMTPVFQRLNATSRVVLIFSETFPLRSFLIQVAQRNFTDGSFIFVPYYALPIFGKAVDRSYSFVSDQNDDLRKALRVCMFYELDPEIRNADPVYAAKWKEISRTKYNYTYEPDEPVSPTVSSTYSATAVLAQVVNRLAETSPDFNWTNGAGLAKYFFNQTFTTNVGHITLNKFGERLTMMTFSYFIQDQNEFQTVLQQNADLNENIRVIETPNWPGPWPVPTEPKCGFRGDRWKCRPKDTKFTLVSAVAGVSSALLCLLVVFIGTRTFLHRQEFYGEWWILDSDRIAYTRRLVGGHRGLSTRNGTMSRL